MCEHTYWNEPARDMSFEEFKYIISQFPRLKWIGLTGIGESFLNKDFLKMITYIKTKDPAIFIELYDSFFFIDDKIARELIRLEVDKIFPSIDAATKETYEILRPGSNFDRVIRNVKHLFELKREMNAYFPKVCFHFVVTKFNFHEIVPYIKLVREIAGDGKVSIQFTRMLHEFKHVKDLFIEIPDKIVSEANKKAKELGVDIFWNTDVPKNKPPINKCTEWLMPFIFVTGHVIPCCAGNEAGHRQFQKETAMGNIFEKSFREIWYGEKYRNLRRMLRNGRVPLPCKNCSLYDVKE